MELDFIQFTHQTLFRIRKRWSGAMAAHIFFACGVSSIDQLIWADHPSDVKRICMTEKIAMPPDNFGGPD
jgi:hypothetical protein